MSKKRREPKADSMQIRYSVRVSNDDHVRIKDYCKRTGVNKSDLFREAVLRRLNESSNSNED